MEYRTNKVSFFASFYDAASDLDDAQRLTFYDACFAYAFEGVEPSFKGVMNTIWKLVKPNIDSSIKGQKTGGQGGRPKTQKPPVSEGENPPFHNGETPCETNMDMELDMDGDMEREEGEFVPLERTNSPSKGASSATAAAKAAPPPRKDPEPHCPMCEVPIAFKDNLGYYHCGNCHDQFTKDKVGWR